MCWLAPLVKVAAAVAPRPTAAAHATAVHAIAVGCGSPAAPCSAGAPPAACLPHLTPVWGTLARICRQTSRQTSPCLSGRPSEPHLGTQRQQRPAQQFGSKNAKVRVESKLAQHRLIARGEQQPRRELNIPRQDEREDEYPNPAPALSECIDANQGYYKGHCQGSRPCVACRARGHSCIASPRRWGARLDAF